MARISATTKLKILDVLDVFKVIGIVVLLIFAVESLHNESTQINTTKDQVIATKAVVDQIKLETRELKNDAHSDHDTLLKSINCMAELFGEHPNQYIPKSEFEACLNGTRIAPFTYQPTTAPTTSQNKNSNTNKDQKQTSTNPGQNQNSQQGQSGSGVTGAIRSIVKFVKGVF